MHSNKKIKITGVFLTIIMTMATSMPVFALDSDLQYKFQTTSKDELIKVGQTSINFDGEIPDYLLNIYDFSPQNIYTSEYGATILVPQYKPIDYTTYAPSNAPISDTFTHSASGTINGLANNGSYNINSGETGRIPEYTYESNSQYPLTRIEEVRNKDGSIGTLSIPAINLKVTVYDGDTYEAMKKGIGHISSTSAWGGNIGMVGHNRGTNDYFGKLKNLDIGDKITYKTNLGTKTYYVVSIDKISDVDWSKLQYTSDNRITLITCVDNSPNQRLCVQAVEKIG